MNKKLFSTLLAIGLVFSAAGSVVKTNSASAEATNKVINKTVAQYDFTDATNLGKDASGSGNDLVTYGDPTVEDANGEKAIVFNGNDVLYAPGSGEDKKGNDFADDLVEEKFTWSFDFWVDATQPVGFARIPIATLWGHMYTGGFDTNLGGYANMRACSLTVGAIEGETAHLRFAWPNSNGTGPDWGPYMAVTVGAWHTFTFTWDPATKTATGTMDNVLQFRETPIVTEGDASATYNFVSNVARFTLGGYYTDPLNGGMGITASDGVSVSTFNGKIKKVSIVKEATVSSPDMLGTSIRIAQDRDGIRFGTAMEKETFDSLVADGATFGMVVIPSALKGESLTVNTANVNNVALPAEKWVEVVGEDGKTYMQAVVCLYDIPENAYSTMISASAYTLYGGNYVYATAIENSISAVAQEAYNDASEEVKLLLDKYLPAQN